jgi:hypothetical protein
MFHKGARTLGGNIDAPLAQQIDGLLDQFVEITSTEVVAAKIRRAVVRSMLTCSLVIVLDAKHLWVAAQKQLGMPSTMRLDRRDAIFPAQEIYAAARWDFGLDDPFVIQFPAILIEQETNVRVASLTAIARSYIQAEVQRVQSQMNIIQINPIFGPAAYAVDPRLAFVLMPFKDDLAKIYQAFIKPTIEAPEFGMVCRRADDVKSNRAIIQDIWKSICEARLIVADLSGLNPNVMYELGIAHTLGKDTLLIYQRGEDIKFPFDLAHIRRIEYVNDALGGRKLEEELRATLQNILFTSDQSLTNPVRS